MCSIGTEQKVALTVDSPQQVGKLQDSQIKDLKASRKDILP